jgi:ketosteroid isomerase-like protein
VPWLAVRLPRLARLYRSALFRLPPDSRPRRELLARAIRDACETWNTGDREAFLAGFDPEIEFNLVGEFGGLDIEDHYHGREGVLRYLAALDDAWQSSRLEPHAVLDFGDRYLALHRLRTRGRGSQVDVEHAIGLLVTWRRGMIVRTDLYWSQDQALEAAGLQDQALEAAGVRE